MTNALQCWYSYLHLMLCGNPVSEKRNPLQHTSTDSRQKLRGAILQMMQPPSGYSLKVWRMPIVWQLASMRKDHRHSVMIYPELRSLMLYSNWPPQLFHLLQSTRWPMMKIAVFSARNKDIKQEIALTLDASNVMSMVTLSWITHIGYLLHEPQQNITNPDLTEAAPLDQVQDTTMKIGQVKSFPVTISFLQTLKLKSS